MIVGLFSPFFFRGKTNAWRKFSFDFFFFFLHSPSLWTFIERLITVRYFHKNEYDFKLILLYPTPHFSLKCVCVCVCVLFVCVHHQNNPSLSVFTYFTCCSSQWMYMAVYISYFDKLVQTDHWQREEKKGQLGEMTSSEIGF